ncbi:unnamed protein product [Trichobilharzia szidati]|nr:unnamed protein product [Trichobilharzia szidati]
MTRAVSHIWELGGGSKLSDLIDVLITPNNILNLHLILVVDLSKPTELWDTVDNLLKSASSRVEQIFSRLRQKNITHIQNTLNENLRKKISSTHPDVELLNPFPLPLTFLGTKYDIFREFSNEQQNLISKTMRFLSHYYGASLYFSSIREDELLKKTRILLNHIAFGGKITFNEQMKTGKPLAIPVGMDSFSNIGNYYYLFELRIMSHVFEFLHKLYYKKLSKCMARSLESTLDQDCMHFENGQYLSLCQLNSVKAVI